MSFARYQTYRDSGLPWLGEIPSHWSIGQSRRLFALRKDRATENDRQLTASQKHGVVYQDEYMALEGQKVVQVVTGADILKHVEPNDFVISMRSFQGGIEWCGRRGCISSAYVMLIPRDSIHVKFFSYLFKCKPYIQALQSTSNLVRDGQALRYENFTLIDLPVIPYSEQQAIAEFLDNETAKIDTLILEQERLIDLLKEKRQAEIAHAVTKGLTPATPMKDSGIEWLGAVPEHWEIKPLKYSASLKGRLGWQGLRSDEYTEDGPFLVTSEHFTNDEIDWDRCYHVSPDRYAIAPEIQLREGDLLMMKDGAAMGKLAYVDNLPGPACLNSHLLLFRPLNGRFENRFLYYVLGGPGFRTYMVQERTGTTFFGLSQESIGAFPFACPPINEQRSILEFLNREASKLDGLTGEAQSAIALLQERRTALISAAVTGKIDVRASVGVPLAEVAAE